LIGVTTSEVRQAKRLGPIVESEPPGHEMALGLTYLYAIEAAGGLPVVMPPLAEEGVEPLLDRFDGICLSGGPDLDPSTYGAGRHPELGPTEPALDRFELAVARRADVREMPILAICRGTQALNIVRGGTLHQHIPELSEEIAHRQQTSGREPGHPIEIAPGTKLRQALGATEVEVEDVLDVNSFHHQAIDRLGEDLFVSACAPDGTIEAVEDPRRDFLIGVQWHAETLVHRPHEATLFRSFVEACRQAGSTTRRSRSGNGSGSVVRSNSASAPGASRSKALRTKPA
jgi:putative glutamine amidotransferase